MPNLSLRLYEPDRRQEIATVHMSLFAQQDLGYTRRRILEFFEYTVPADLLERQLDRAEQTSSISLRLQRGQSVEIDLVTVKRQANQPNQSSNELQSALRSRDQCLLIVKDWLSNRQPLTTVHDAESYRRALVAVEADFQSKADQVRAAQMALEEIRKALSTVGIAVRPGETLGRTIVECITTLVQERDGALVSEEAWQDKHQRLQEALKGLRSENSTLLEANNAARAEIEQLRRRIAEDEAGATSPLEQVQAEDLTTPDRANSSRKQEKLPKGHF